MRILISPTAFKGTLSPYEAARKITRAVRRQFPGAIVCVLPLADGGDGTLEVVSRAMKVQMLKTKVEGPLGKKVLSKWAIANAGRSQKMAIIEMARASGLALTKGRNRVMEATSAGTGELIRAALDQGCRKILIGIGGTACAEGGAGALRALGLRYFDKNGMELSAQPKELLRLAHVSWDRFDPRIKNADIQLMCDVKNPLLGKNGSARVYGPQKGATPKQVVQIEKILRNWACFARVPAANKPGAGAAGALAFGLVGFAGAKLVQGTITIMHLLDWFKAARKADLIVTGEGRLDQTSFQGKVIGEILKRRGKAKVIAVCGSSVLSKRIERKFGLSAVYQLKEFI